MLDPINSIKKEIKEAQKEIKEVQREFKERTATLILAGFGMIAALAWNEAIKSLFEAYLPKSGELLGKFLYAAVITLIVVVISRYLGKISEKKQ